MKIIHRITSSGANERANERSEQRGAGEQVSGQAQHPRPEVLTGQAANLVADQVVENPCKRFMRHKQPTEPWKNRDDTIN